MNDFSFSKIGEMEAEDPWSNVVDNISDSDQTRNLDNDVTNSECLGNEDKIDTSLELMNELNADEHVEDNEEELEDDDQEDDDLEDEEPITTEMRYFRLDINPSLLQTKQPTEFYGFSYPPANYNREEKLLAQSLNDLSDMHNIKSRHYPIKHQFVTAAYEAFDKHYGFVLSPSQIYLLVLQAVSIHVSKHTSKLESHLISEREVENEEERKNQRTAKEIFLKINAHPHDVNWNSALTSIRQQIHENVVSDIYNLYSVSDFPSASEEEIIASEVSLMENCKEFNEYDYLPTLCGIPFFLLDGEVEEWQLLREKSESLITKRMSPAFADRWLAALLPILDKFLLARKGDEVDIPFWKSFFKRGEKKGSGAYTFISGWINVFFPYHSFSSGKDVDVFNKFCVPYSLSPLYVNLFSEKDDVIEEDDDDVNQLITGLNINSFPLGLSTVPVTWLKGKDTLSLHLYSGFVGTVQHDDYLCPLVGWWISQVQGEKSTNEFSEMHKDFGDVFR
jgi:hypothetical protein